MKSIARVRFDDSRKDYYYFTLITDLVPAEKVNVSTSRGMKRAHFYSYNNEVYFHGREPQRWVVGRVGEEQQVGRTYTRLEKIKIMEEYLAYEDAYERAEFRRPYESFLESRNAIQIGELLADLSLSGGEEEEGDERVYTIREQVFIMKHYLGLTSIRDRGTFRRPYESFLNGMSATEIQNRYDVLTGRGTSNVGPAGIEHHEPTGWTEEEMQHINSSTSEHGADIIPTRSDLPF